MLKHMSCIIHNLHQSMQHTWKTAFSCEQRITETCRVQTMLYFYSIIAKLVCDALLLLSPSTPLPLLMDTLFHTHCMHATVTYFSRSLIRSPVSWWSLTVYSRTTSIGTSAGSWQTRCRQLSTSSWSGRWFCATIGGCRCRCLDRLCSVWRSMWVSTAFTDDNLPWFTLLWCHAVIITAWRRSLSTSDVSLPRTLTRSGRHRSIRHCNHTAHPVNSDRLPDWRY